MSSPVGPRSLLSARSLHFHGDLQVLRGAAATQARDGGRIACIQAGSKAHIAFRGTDPVRHVETYPTEPLHPRLGPGVVCFCVRSLLQYEVTRDVTCRDGKVPCGGNEDVCVI